MNSDGAVAFLEAGLERSLKETTRQQSAAMKTVWLEPFQRVFARSQAPALVVIHKYLEARHSGRDCRTR
jgi:hypothetical protein